MISNIIYLVLLIINQQKAFGYHPVTIDNHVLVGHTFQTLYAESWLNCIHACHDEPKCISYNYERSAITNGICELNNFGVWCDRHESLVYSLGFVFQQLRENKRSTKCSLDNKVDYRLYFPNDGTSQSVSVGGTPNLAAMTICFWIKVHGATHPIPILRYYKLDEQRGSPNNELEMRLDSNKLTLLINNVESVIHVSDMTTWHFFRVTWNSGGIWKFFEDGALKRSGSFAKGHVIPGDGTLELGPEYSTSEAAGEKSTYRFRGELTGVNIWDDMLNDEKILYVSSRCPAREGNMFKWSAFKDRIKGNVQIRTPAF